MTDEIVTDVVTPAPKLFSGARTGRPSIDLNDFDALRRAALDLAEAPSRLVMGVSLDEMRALFRLAAIGGKTIQLAADLISASDAGMPREAVETYLAALIEFVRPLMEAPKCQN